MASTSGSDDDYGNDNRFADNEAFIPWLKYH